MIDFAAWVEKQSQVTNLQLDAQNPRIPPSNAPLGQRELIAELVQHDKVYELARQITEQGYSPVEAMIGVVEDGKQIILEGQPAARRAEAAYQPGIRARPGIRPALPPSGGQRAD